METSDLIRQYYVDRVKEINTIEDRPHGLLMVKAYFYYNSVNIYVICARNLENVDTRGRFFFLQLSNISILGDVIIEILIYDNLGASCDSFVRIKLLPEEIFQTTKTHKTATHKDTFYPLYKESFSM